MTSTETKKLKRLFIDEQRVISDSILVSEWPTNEQVEWILKTRHGLIDKATASEYNAMDLLDSYNLVYTFQQPFVIDGSVYFTDLFFNPIRLAIEIDGEYHNPREQKHKDLDKEIALLDYGVKTYRIQNIETEDEELLEKLFTSLISRRCCELFGYVPHGIGNEYYEGLTPEQVNNIGNLW